MGQMFVEGMYRLLEYKGYYTKMEYSADDRVFHGKLEGIPDLVNFQSDTMEDVENQFHLAVDDYLSLCKSMGVKPDKD